MILMAKQFMKRRCIIVYIFLYLVNNTMGQDYKQVYMPLRPFQQVYFTTGLRRN